MGPGQRRGAPGIGAHGRQPHHPVDSGLPRRVQERAFDGYQVRARDGEQEHLAHPLQGGREALGAVEIPEHRLDPPGFHERPGVLPADHHLERLPAGLEVLDKFLANGAGGAGYENHDCLLVGLCPIG
jgi:hypothetical protein